MKSYDAKQLVGLLVQWDTVSARDGSYVTQTGIMKSVSGKSVTMDDGDRLWLPDMINLRRCQEATIIE